MVRNIALDPSEPRSRMLSLILSGIVDSLTGLFRPVSILVEDGQSGHAIRGFLNDLCCGGGHTSQQISSSLKLIQSPVRPNLAGLNRLFTARPSLLING